MAFSFVKFNLDQVMDIEGKAKDWAKNHPEIIFTSRAEGMGMDAITVTVHKDYAAYKEFLLKNKKLWGKFMADVHYILVHLNGEITKPLSFKYLAEKQENEWPVFN